MKIGEHDLFYLYFSTGLEKKQPRHLMVCFVKGLGDIDVAVCLIWI